MYYRQTIGASAHDRGGWIMNALEACLRQVPYFAALEPGVLRELAGSVRERRYEAGETVLIEGEPCEGL